MDWVQVVSIVLGSGFLSGLITTLLTQAHQRKENRFEPRREAYADVLAAMDTFEKMAEQAHRRLLDEKVQLVDSYMDMLDDGTHPLSRPLAQVQLLAPDDTVQAVQDAVDEYTKYYLATVGRVELRAAHDRVVTLMRKDLGSVS